MQNIKVLLQFLRNNHWHMTSFFFNYKRCQYIVLFEDIKNLDIASEGYDVLLTFIDTNDENRIFSVKANEHNFKFKVKEFREFFGIEYSPNLGDVFKQFYEWFNQFIPTTIDHIPSQQEKRLIVSRLNKHDNDNNMCCYKVKRNPIVNGKQHRRTIFNSQKCRMLKADLYQRFENDDTISFCFRKDNELTTAEILKNFTIHEVQLHHIN